MINLRAFFLDIYKPSQYTKESTVNLRLLSLQNILRIMVEKLNLLSLEFFHSRIFSQLPKKLKHHKMKDLTKPSIQHQVDPRDFIVPHSLKHLQGLYVFSSRHSFLHLFICTIDTNDLTEHVLVAGSGIMETNETHRYLVKFTVWLSKQTHKNKVTQSSLYFTSDCFPLI